jgi:hypothetical protein
MRSRRDAQWIRGDILHTYKTEIKTLHLNLILLISVIKSNRLKI